MNSQLPHRGLRRGLGVGLLIGALSIVAVGEAKAQYGPRANPLTGVRTGLRYQPALASPFAATRVGGFGTSLGLSRYGGFYGSRVGLGGLYGPGLGGLYGPGLGGFYGPGLGGFYGPGFGVGRYSATSFRSGFGLGGFGLGVRSFGYTGTGLGVGIGAPVATSFSLNVGGVGYPGYGLGGWGLGYPAYGAGFGYGSPWLYGRYPYGTVGINTITYGTPYPYGSIGYGGFPYGYGYGYRGGYFGY